jgi:hypothetical protein
VETLTLKVRIAVLWIFMAVAMSAHGILFVMEPGSLEKMMSGQVEGMTMSPAMILFMAIFWWVPLVMAFLSVTLKDAANRRVNMVLAIIFTILNIYHLVEHIMNPSPAQLLMVASTVVVTALIIWYSAKWPKVSS